MGCKFRAGIGTHVIRTAPRHHEVSQDGETARALHATRNVDRQAVSRERIDDCEHADLTPVPGAVLTDIISPDVVRTRGPKPFAGPIVEPKPPPFWLLLRDMKAVAPEHCVAHWARPKGASRGNSVESRSDHTCWQAQ